jgi:hypothetical protein
MLQIYIIIGLIWSVYTLSKNRKSNKSHREHWFTAGFFSFLLWPFLMWSAYDKGFIQEDLEKLKSHLK